MEVGLCLTLPITFFSFLQKLDNASNSAIWLKKLSKKKEVVCSAAQAEVILGNLFSDIVPAFCTLLVPLKKTRSTTPAYVFLCECKQKMKRISDMFGNERHNHIHT